jgi:hypothetical protein
MKTLLILIVSLLLLNPIYGQIDSVNTKSNILKTERLALGKKTYIVYLQDSLHGAKYNFEIWDRILTQNKTVKTNTLQWIRHKNGKGEEYRYEIKFDDKLIPLSEQVVHQQKTSSKRKYFIYKNDGMYSSQDTLLHNTKAFKLNTLRHSFNWELDLETISCLPLAANKTFAINFYHPGSKTLPKYYKYSVDRVEVLTFNKISFRCWVVKVVYSEHQSSEFWVDQTTHTVLQMKEEFYGRYRFKRLVL